MKYTIGKGFAGEEIAKLRKENEQLKVENKQLKAQIENYEQERQQLWQRIDKYKEDLKKLRVAFIQAQAMALNGGKSFEDIIGQVQDINFGVSN